MPSQTQLQSVRSQSKPDIADMTGNSLPWFEECMVPMWPVICVQPHVVVDAQTRCRQASKRRLIPPANGMYGPSGNALIVRLATHLVCDSGLEVRLPSRSTLLRPCAAASTAEVRVFEPSRTCFTSLTAIYPYMWPSLCVPDTWQTLSDHGINLQSACARHALTKTRSN